MILQLIKTCLISHKQPQNAFSQVRLLKFHKVTNTDIIHVSISQISFSGLIDCFQGLKVVVLLVFNTCFNNIKL